MIIRLATESDREAIWGIPFTKPGRMNARRQLFDPFFFAPEREPLAADKER
ncbi:MAG: hypothetical protein QOE70_6627 [Chthoniobacter sp.]|jgi:hypothetical protein|nr:hypothetical protein [Chthoniobacter sp.]